MNRKFKVIGPPATPLPYLGPYQEIALCVRELLKCEYALVATPDEDFIRIQAIAGGENETDESLAASVLSKIRDWGPVVVDDSRLIAVPVSSDGRVIAVLVGYSSTPGTFTTSHLEKLMAYSHVAVGAIAAAANETPGETRTTFSHQELLQFSRLITIGELSACFAHEVMNPLMLIQGHLRFVDEDLPRNHPLRMSFEVIERASRRIEEMAKRMLDFSKKRTRRTEPCDVAELISDALRFVQPYVRSCYVDVKVHLDPQLAIIDIDRWQMVQAIVNLLQNAVDAMADRERRVLTITARVEAGEMRIVISDTGAGIASANVGKVFEPFFTTKGERGTGLGLYITKQVIEEHRGTINVQTGDRGTAFVISLPI
jgi:signal transduction histidine kinase